MIRKIIISTVCSLLTIIASAAPSGDWKLHSSFDDGILKIIDTPSKVYLQVLSQPVVEDVSGYSESFPVIFEYDKDSETMLGLNKRNRLSENIVSFIDYNPDKKYLIVIYSNSSIDFIYESGDVYNVSGLMSASVPFSKNVNFVTFDPDNDRVYVATDFGFVVLNDEKHEIASSRIYGYKIKAAGRVGKNLIVFDESKAFFTPADSNDPSFSSLTPIEGITSPTRLMPIDDKSFAYLLDGYPSALFKVTISDDGSFSTSKLTDDAFTTVSHNKNGYCLTSGAQIYYLDNKGQLRAQALNAEDRGLQTSSWDGSEIWFAKGRKGLKSMKFSNGNWSLTRDFIMPDAPSAFIAQSMVYSDRYGMLVSNRGDGRQLGITANVPPLLCALKNGHWDHYAPAYRHPERTSVITDPRGLAIDPNDPKYVYQASRFNGIVRFNLDDPTDILHMSRPNDPDKDNPGFKVIAPLQKYDVVCGFTAPEFDSQGNLWAAFENNDIPKTSPYAEVYVWPSEDRRKGNADGWKTIRINGIYNCWKGKSLPLRHSSNKNIVIVCPGEAYDPIAVLDHKGTLDTPSDDDVVIMRNLYDQDGNSLSCQYVYSMYEDMSTGLVWVGTDAGIFTINPRTVFSNPSRINRIKVARNDGTNLADYLLEGVPISAITSDRQGRKWFATEGAGLVCTSGDGRTINFTLTTANSFLPHDNVYGIAQNPANNSMIVSTAHGLAEFYPSGASSDGKKMDSVKVYPNPVRPDYLGWVTIEGLVDKAQVKIIDSMGGLVKELGPAEGGSIQWDCTNLDRKKVTSGVYYVLAASGPGEDNLAKVAKILVVR